MASLCNRMLAVPPSRSSAPRSTATPMASAVLSARGHCARRLHGTSGGRLVLSTTQNRVAWRGRRSCVAVSAVFEKFSERYVPARIQSSLPCMRLLGMKYMTIYALLCHQRSAIKSVMIAQQEAKSLGAPEVRRNAHTPMTSRVCCLS